MIRGLILILSLVFANPGWGQQPYRFGVSPQKSATRLAMGWTPFLNYLAQHSGVPLIFSTARDSATFSKKLAAGEFDFCFVNPQQYLQLHEAPGYQAFAREKGRLLQGILVTRKDSGIETLGALNGAEIAFPSPTSFAASVLSQAELRKAGVEFSPRYVGSHASVYLNVAKGLTPAGGGIVRSLELAPASVRNDLKILLQTDGYTPHAIASHPRIDPVIRLKLQAAVSKLDSDPQGVSILQAVGFKGIQVANDSDWDTLRRLKLPAPPR